MEFQSLNTAIGFAAEVSGIDLSQSMDDDIFLSIRDGLDRFGVLVFCGQALDEDSQIAFSRRFGPLETSIRRHRSRNVGRDELSDISNVAPDGGIYAMDSEHMSYNLGNQLWHADSSFKKVPALASLLYATEVPPRGGETEFCDQRAAWDHLDEAMQTRLEGLTGQHSLAHSRAKTSYEADKSFREGELAEVPPVPQALVQQNPRTGRKALYVGAHLARVNHMAAADSDALLAALRQRAEAPQLQHRHIWQPGDLVIWDDRATLHRGRPWDNQCRRIMRRTTVAGDKP